MELSCPGGGLSALLGASLPAWLSPKLLINQLFITPPSPSQRHCTPPALPPVSSVLMGKWVAKSWGLFGVWGCRYRFLRPSFPRSREHTGVKAQPHFPTTVGVEVKEAEELGAGDPGHKRSFLLCPPERAPQGHHSLLLALSPFWAPPPRLCLYPHSSRHTAPTSRCSPSPNLRKLSDPGKSWGPRPGRHMRYDPPPYSAPR